MSTPSPATVMFLMTLTSLDLRDEYETWVREVDTPGALALPGIDSYRVFRLEEDAIAGPNGTAYHYIEVIAVSDLETYRKSLQTLPASFFETLRTYIGESVGVAGVLINPN